MEEKNRISSFLDYLGLGSLLGATAALAGVLWFGEFVPEKMLFSCFYAFLAVAITSFFISRLADIIRLVLQTPDPRSQRVPQAFDSVQAAPAALVSDTGAIGRDKFPRAA